MKAILSMIMSGAGYLTALVVLVICGGLIALSLLASKMGNLLLKMARKLWDAIRALLGEKEAQEVELH